MFLRKKSELEKNIDALLNMIECANKDEWKWENGPIHNKLKFHLFPNTLLLLSRTTPNMPNLPVDKTLFTTRQWKRYCNLKSGIGKYIQDKEIKLQREQTIKRISQYLDGE